MDKIKIETEQNIELEYNIASIGERILAWLIDYIILMIYIIIVIFVIIQFFGGFDYIEDVYVFYILAFLPFFLYHPLFEIFFNGQTPGKKIVKVKVVRLDGSRPTIGGYILRWFLRLIDIIPYGLPAILSFLFSEKGQRLGDRAAGTTVIKLKKMEEISKKINVDIDPSYVIQFEGVRDLRDEHISIINEVLALPYTAKRNYLGTSVARKIKTYLNVESDLPDIRFLNTIVKDYYYTFLKEEQNK